MRERAPQPFGRDVGRVQRLLGQQDHELARTGAVDRVAGADLVHERAARAPQDVVVGGLEPDHRDAVRVAVTHDARAQRRQVLLEPRAAPGAGQRVAARVLAHAPVHAADPLGGDQPAFELGGVQRLGEDVVGAGAHRLARRRLTGAPGQQQDVGVVALAIADARDQLGPVELGHRPVGDQDLGVVELEGAQAFLAVGGLQRAVAKPFHGFGDRQARAGLVVDDEDLHSGGRSER